MDMVWIVHGMSIVQNDGGVKKNLKFLPSAFIIKLVKIITIRFKQMFLFIMLLTLTVPSYLAGQSEIIRAAEVTRPWVAVSLPGTAADDTGGEVLAGILADTIELTLQLIGRYEVRPRPEVSDSITDAGTAALAAEKEELDYLVFGRVERRTDGSTLFEISVYSRETGEVSLKQATTAASIFDTFDKAEELATEILGAFTGQRIAYGSLSLTNLAEDPGNYLVRLDGVPVGRNIQALERILVGPREVEILSLEGESTGRPVSLVRMTFTEGAREELAFFLAAQRVVEPEPEPEPEPEAEAETAAETDPVEPDPPAEIAEEPSEIPLELRLYPWNREDYREQGITGTSFDINLEVQKDGYYAPGWGITTRIDRGRRHSLFWGYRYSVLAAERAEDDPEFDPQSIEGTELLFIPANLFKLLAGYGRRFRPFADLTLIPTISLGLQGGSYRPAFQDGEGQWLKIDTDSEYFWSILMEPALTAEISFGSLSLQGRAGFMWLYYIQRSYPESIELYSQNLDGFISFPVSMDLLPGYGFTAGVGLSYSWAGSNEIIRKLAVEERPYRAFLPGERRRWGLSFAPSLGLPFILAPDVNQLDFFFDFPSSSLSFDFLFSSGSYLDLSAFVVAPRFRENAIYMGHPGEFTTSSVQIDVISGSIGTGTRNYLGNNLFLKTGYQLAPFDLSSYLRVERVVLRTGPSVALERSFPGSSVMTFASMNLLSTLPLGEIKQTENRPGLFDGYVIAPSFLTGSLGIRFHAAGTPAPMLTPRQKDREDRRITASMGAGMEWVFSPYGSRTNIQGFHGVLPVKLHLPGNWELSFRAPLPVFPKGVSGDRETYEITDDTHGPLTFQDPFSAVPRINRLSAAEIGYHAKGRGAFSFRPALRYSWADMELWGLEALLDDDTPVIPGDDSFTITGKIHWIGLSLEGRLRIGSRMALHLASSMSVQVSPGDSTIHTPMEFPTIDARNPDQLYTTSLYFSMSL